MKVTIQCADKYEAQKLSSVLYVKDDVNAQLAEILDVIGEECVVMLRDSSAHSILLSDPQNAALLADFVQSVQDKTHQIVDVQIDGELVSIEKR